MTKATQDLAVPETEPAKATPGQVRQIIEGLVPKDLSFSRAEFLDQSGILPSILAMDPGMWDRNAFDLAFGVKPYLVKRWGELVSPVRRPYTLTEFREYLSNKHVVLGIHDSSQESVINSLASRDILSEGPTDFSIIKLKRYIPLETLVSILERDHYRPATLGELFWFMGHRYTSLNGRNIWCLGSSEEKSEGESKYCIITFDLDPYRMNRCSLYLHPYNQKDFQFHGGERILVKSV